MESQRESLEQEFAGLNLSRYVQEAVSDFTSMALLCSGTVTVFACI